MKTHCVLDTPSGNIKVNNEGVFQISEYQGSATPAIVEGLIFSASSLFVGN
jgi:hypothetical protein